METSFNQGPRMRYAGMQKRPGPCGTGRIVGKGRWADSGAPREPPRGWWPTATFPLESLDSVTMSSLLLGGSSTGVESASRVDPTLL